LFVLPSPQQIFFCPFRRVDTRTRRSTGLLQHYGEVAFSLGKSHGTVDSYRMLWSTLTPAIKLLSTYSPHGLAFCMCSYVYLYIYVQGRGPTEDYGGGWKESNVANTCKIATYGI
jgi:hypothetical protein